MIKKLRKIFLLLCLASMVILTACSNSESLANNNDTVKTFSTVSPIAVPPAAGGCCE